jgi:hypothetical protein
MSIWTSWRAGWKRFVLVQNLRQAFEALRLNRRLALQAAAVGPAMALTQADVPCILNSRFCPLERARARMRAPERDSPRFPRPMAAVGERGSSCPSRPKPAPLPGPPGLAHRPDAVGPCRWTGIGWVIALVWAVMAVRPKSRTLPTQTSPAPPCRGPP